MSVFFLCTFHVFIVHIFVTSSLTHDRKQRGGATCVRVPGVVARAYMAQTGSRETEDKVRSQPSVVAQAGATRPFPRLRGDHRTKEKTNVAWRRQRTGLHGTTSKFWHADGHVSSDLTGRHTAGGICMKSQTCVYVCTISQRGDTEQCESRSAGRGHSQCTQLGSSISSTAWRQAGGWCRSCPWCWHWTGRLLWPKGEQREGLWFGLTSWLGLWLGLLFLVVIADLG